MIEGEGYTLIPGTCQEVLRDYEDGTFSSIVCDPIYNLSAVEAALGVAEPAAWAEVFRVAAPGAFLVLFGHPRVSHGFACMLENLGWVYVDTLCQLVDGREQSRRRLRQGWRPVSVLCKGLSVLQDSVQWSTTAEAFNLGSLISLVTPPGGCVLDPFMGSGTTGIAALEHGFSFVGIDHDPHDFEIARKRIQERFK